MALHGIAARVPLDARYRVGAVTVMAPRGWDYLEVRSWDGRDGGHTEEQAVSSKTVVLPSEPRSAANVIVRATKVSSESASGGPMACQVTLARIPSGPSAKPRACTTIAAVASAPATLA